MNQKRESVPLQTLFFHALLPTYAVRLIYIQIHPPENRPHTDTLRYFISRIRTILPAGSIPGCIVLSKQYFFLE